MAKKPSVEVSLLGKICRSTDFEALELLNVQSGDVELQASGIYTYSITLS